MTSSFDGSARWLAKRFSTTTQDKILGVAVLLALLHAIYILSVHIGGPIAGYRSFRPSQTALTAYWLLRGGNWLAYETPVLGAPWSIPFEFPTFQLLNATLASTGIPLNAAGRIVAFAFYIGTLWPLRTLFEATGMGRPAFRVTAILFLTCPLYVYWGRAIMIETCALFFAVLWLSTWVKFLAKASAATGLLCIVSGCLAILTKSTTLPAFTVVGCCVAVAALMRLGRSEFRRADLVRTGCGLALIVSIVYAVGFAWVLYTDHIKAANEFGRMLTSEALVGWNLGSLDQRVSAKLWVATIWTRSMKETLGWFYPLALIALVAVFLSGRSRGAIGLCVLGYLVPFLVFTNLHIVHNYYQAANAIFLLAAVGVAVGEVYAAVSRTLAVIVVLAIVIGQIGFFHQFFSPKLNHDEATTDQNWTIGQIAKSLTSPDQSLLIFGSEWSSQVSYSAERKALALPGWTPAPMIERVLSDPQAFLGDRPLGGVIFCTSRAYGDARPAIEAFANARKVLAEFKGCRLLSPLP